MSFSQITTDPPVYGGMIEPINATASNGRPSANYNNLGNNSTSNDSSTTSRSNLSWLSPLIGIGSDIINYFLNRRDYKEQFEMNNKEWTRRFNLTNSYNEQWADRLRAQGINPLSAIGQGVSGNSASMAGGPQMMSGPLSSMSNFLQSLATGANIENTQTDTGLKSFDILLKEQLLNFNATNNPTLIAEGKARLQNTLQEYHNLIAEENYDKKAAEELAQRIKQEQAQIVSLNVRSELDRANISIAKKKLVKLSQDIETGNFVQEYEKWHAKHEEQLKKLAEKKYDITESEYEQFYKNGIFGQMKRAEVANIISAFRTSESELQMLWNTDFRYLPSTMSNGELWATMPDTVGSIALFIGDILFGH